MNYVNQAKELQYRIRNALLAIQADGTACFTEDEVQFRQRAIEGVLIMANNDVSRIVRVWEEDYAQTHPPK